MDEYINREAVYEYFDKCNSENPKWTPSRVKTLISRQKAADVAPVRHGRWIHHIAGGKQISACWCSVCNVEHETEQNYCPNCGADMRGSNDE